MNAPIAIALLLAISVHLGAAAVSDAAVPHRALLAADNATKCQWDAMEQECMPTANALVFPQGFFRQYENTLSRFKQCFNGQHVGAGWGSKGCINGTSPMFCETKFVFENWGDTCLPTTSQVKTDQDLALIVNAQYLLNSCSFETISSSCLRNLTAAMSLMGCNCDAQLQDARSHANICYTTLPSQCPGGPRPAAGNPAPAVTDGQLISPVACTCPKETHDALIVGCVLGFVILLLLCVMAAWAARDRGYFSTVPAWFGPCGGNGRGRGSSKPAASKNSMSHMDMGESSVFVNSKGNGGRSWFWNPSSVAGGRAATEEEGRQLLQKQASHQRALVSYASYSTSNSAHDLIWEPPSTHTAQTNVPSKDGVPNTR